MSFKDIKGQDRAVSFLKGSLQSGRVSHAYIFYGPRGVGKMRSAVNFAKALNCEAPVEKPCDPSTLRHAQGRPEQSRRTTGSGSHPERVEGCDGCPACRKIDASAHPDFCVVRQPDGALSIGINEIRGLIGDISLKPYEAKKKVYVLDRVNALTDQAANALLKTLEEPPTDSVLILIVENLGALLPTIVSRSQVVKFFPLPTDTIRVILVKAHGVEDKRAGVLASLASGSIGEAIKYMDGKFFEKRSALVKALADGTFFDQDFDRVPRAELKTDLNIMLTWYRDIMVAKALGASDAALVNIDMKETIARDAGTIGFDRLDRIIKQIILTGSFLEQNVNPKLAMAALGITI